MISVFINLRTVDYHLTILTNQLLIFLNKKKNQNYKQIIGKKICSYS